MVPHAHCPWFWVVVNWVACENLGLYHRDQLFPWRHRRGEVLSGSRISPPQVSEPESRTGVTAWFSWLFCAWEKGYPGVFWEGEAVIALGRWDCACIWESGPAAFVLLQRDIIGRCHLSTYILRENYPLGLAEEPLSTRIAQHLSQDPTADDRMRITSKVHIMAGVST